MTQAPVTLITGASGGICSALARRLAAAGHRLALTALEPEPLASLAAELRAGGAEVAAVHGDVRDRSLPAALVGLACERFGRIDNLVTGAGASRPVPFVELDDDEWDKLADLNLGAVFRVSKAVVRHMLAQGEGGAIVHISSIAHANGGANLAYGSAKGGVATLTYGMAQQLGPKGIRVNAVAPGIIDTPMVRGGFASEFDALVEGAARRTPLGRLGRPDDVAAVIAAMDPAGHELAVNATSLGMREADPLPIAVARLDADAIVAEIIMKPELTPLLAAAQARGLRIHPGKPMLESQIRLMAEFLRIIG